MLEIVAMVLFPLLMAYAAVSDLITMKISNRISIVLVLAFIPIALASGMTPSALVEQHILCGAFTLCITFTLFAFGWIGGGDAKLAASTAVWLGWSSLYDYGLDASMFGAALTILILALRRVTLPVMLLRQDWLMRLQRPGNGVPYGIALALAAFAIYPETVIWTSLTAP